MADQPTQTERSFADVVAASDGAAASAMAPHDSRQANGLAVRKDKVRSSLSSPAPLTGRRNSHRTATY